jgi:hypothetical protein
MDHMNGASDFKFYKGYPYYLGLNLGVGARKVNQNSFTFW